MEIVALLKRAIEERKPISFQYLVPGKSTGTRYGNPYAIMFHPSTGNSMAHILQTGGASDSGKRLPTFKLFILKYIKNISIQNEEDSFEIVKYYDPYSPLYSKIITKI